MSDVNISKFRAQVVRDGSKPATPGFVVSEGQSPTDPAGSGQNHLPVTIAAASTGLAITESQILGGAGTVAQYIRGDGSLADFPATTGGGSSVSYYLNGSVSQGTIGGVAYREVNRNPVFGAGTDIATSSNGYIANFITDAGDPNKLLIPAGNWNLETYFSANSGGGSPTFYVELYKYDGTTFTLIATSSGTPELIAFGTNINPYFTTLAVPETVLALTDRLALRYYVNTSGRTITLHTENAHLCQVITTFTTGLTALNGLTSQVQFFAVGTSGTDFNIASSVDTHTFNLPTASATNRGALSSADWSTFNNKENAITAGTTAQYFRGDKTFQTLNTSVVPEGTNLYYTEARVNANTNVAANTAARHNAVTIGTANGLSLSTQVLSLGLASAGVTGSLSGTDWSTFNSKQNALTLTTTGTSGAATLVGSTLNIPQYQAAGTYVTAVTASSPLASSGGTTPNITIQQASGSQNGFLSSTDWSTFNSKQNALTNPVTGTGTTNYLPKFTGSTTVGNSQVFDNGTNVGIGTGSSGGGRLNIQNIASNPFINIRSTNNVFDILTMTFDESTDLFSITNKQAFAASGIAFGTNNTERVRITQPGNLLVGTTTDNGAKIQVNGNATINGDLGLGVTTPLSGGGAAKWLTLEGNSTYSGGIIYSVSSSAKFYHYLDNDGLFAHQGQSSVGQKFITNATERMRITSSGNVGIGSSNTDPLGLARDRNLAIVTTGTNSALTIVGGGAARIDFGVGGTRTAGIYSDSGNYTEIFTSTALPLVFSTNATERMRITSSGNVGIGTTSPAERLHVETSNEYQITWARTGAGKRWAIGTDTAGFYFNNRTDSVLPLYITNGGNVLIGTTTDVGAKLYVNGGIRTANPTGSTSNDWLLGRALVSGSSTPDRWIRVQIGNLYYDILAVYMGSV
jgi:hypothetical protein